MALLAVVVHERYVEVFARYIDLGIVRERNDVSGAITLRFASDLQVERYREMYRRYWYGR